MPINIVDFFDESDELRNNGGIRIFPIISIKVKQIQMKFAYIS